MRAIYEAMYGLGLTPWERGVVAAELRTVVGGRPAGRAVDLGCGTGLAARFLAGRGWSVTAVDVVRAAVAHGQGSDPDGRVTWRVGDVARADQVDPDGSLTHAVDLVVDDRCLHGLPDGDRAGWADTVGHLAAPGGELLVHAGARSTGWRPGPAGLDPDELTGLLGEAWRPRPSPGLDWFHLVLAPAADAPSPTPTAGPPAMTT